MDGTSSKWETMLDSEVALGAYVRHDAIMTGPGLRSRLKLTPGKHTIHVSFILGATRSGVGLHPPAPVQVVSNPVEIEILPAEEKPDVQVEGERAWGEAVEGVQMRVRPRRQRWYEGETPKFLVDMRNEGAVEWVLGLTQENWEIEVDGLWYRVGAMFTGVFPMLPFGPGREHKDIEFYPGEWSNWNLHGKPLKLTPGWHTVRLSFGPSTRDRAYWRRLRTVSNPVLIEILPAEADNRDWGQAVAGLQCGLRADKRLFESGETPQFQAVVRNVGEQAWPWPAPPLSVR